MLINKIEDADLKNGSILLVDKPLRWTSFDVVNKIKYEIKRITACKNFKIGHAGTLDPLASGLLLVCIGKCTKMIEEIQSLPKEYTGDFTLGATTASFDLEHKPENFLPFAHISTEQINAAANQLTGTIQQYPPIFSAVKVAGKRAFDYARQAQEVKLQPKQVTIHSFEIEKVDLPEITFTISCSKGTYVRAIARDLGELLECGAYLSQLRRTKTGNFSVEHALNFTPYLSQRDETKFAGKKRGFEE
ncbi:MAG: tRNA pseudouridine(55) synthase TruB [Lentimicrobiaceae bacterium]|nr:tRNA pseudouridine(55) synthase TruB [Lentimicrobiaceae bacterium]